MNECRYYCMCEDAYEHGCNGIDNICWNYEPMPDRDALIRIADKILFYIQNKPNSDYLWKIYFGIVNACGKVEE